MKVMDVLYGKKGSNNRVNWLRCGILFVNDDDSIRLRLDAFPVAADFDGWLVVKERQKNGSKDAVVEDVIEEDIPF